MQHILIPTDFSSCAQNAEQAGMDLAKRNGATIHLFHHTTLPKNWEEKSREEKAKHPDILKKLEQIEATFLKIQQNYPTITIKTHIVGGKWLVALEQFIEQHNISLIIMGSHGISGKNEYFIGSNTQKVVRSIHCPVLVIKNRLKKLDFNKVIYASTFDLVEKEAFLKFKDIIKFFLPELHLVSLHNSEFLDGPLSLQKEAMKDFAVLGKPLNVKTHIIKGFSVDGGIRKFAKSIDADLIAISNQYRRPLKRMLVGSNVEALVNHAEIPVLTIDFRD
jgi:nucleotide-binding universal stress UspA family protein